MFLPSGGARERRSAARSSRGVRGVLALDRQAVAEDLGARVLDEVLGHEHDQHGLGLAAALELRVRLDVAREEGLAEQRTLVDQYNALSQQQLDDDGLLLLQDIQQQIEASGCWNLEQKVDTIMTQLGLPANKRLDELSGGWQRRVATCSPAARTGRNGA